MEGVVSDFFFFNDTATTEIYTLSLHDALPISPCPCGRGEAGGLRARRTGAKSRNEKNKGCSGSKRPHVHLQLMLDRKSTRLNSSHANISYAVFCLKKKKKKVTTLAFYKYSPH